MQQTPFFSILPVIENINEAEFILPVRVFYEDTDAGGVVYHANYLKYMDRARTQWLLQIGINLQTWAQQHSEIFVVKKVSIDYVKPAKLLDDLLVISSLAAYSKVRMTFLQKIMHADTLLASGLIEVVCVNSLTLRPTRFPDAIIEWHSKLNKS